MGALKPSVYVLWIAIPILTTLNQAFIKLLASEMKSMDFGRAWLLEAAQSPWTAGILACEILSFVLWLKLLADTSISKAAPITAVAYVLILLMSWTVFREPIMPLQIIGSIMILAGVWLIATASIRTPTAPSSGGA